MVHKWRQRASSIASCVKNAAEVTAKTADMVIVSLRDQGKERTIPLEDGKENNRRLVHQFEGIDCLWFMAVSLRGDNQSDLSLSLRVLNVGMWILTSLDLDCI